MSNDKHKVYISYAWKGESEDIADKLDESFQASGITIVRDKRNLGYKGLIRNFMQQIGQGNAVIAIISDKYLKSPNCMYELVEIAKNEDMYDRIFPLVLEDADIYDPAKSIKYINHWEEKINELKESIKGVDPTNLQGIYEKLNLYDDIRDNISRLIAILSDMNTLTKKLHEESGFASLISAIKDRLQETEEETTQKSETEDFVEAALRTLGHPTKIYHRAEIEKKLLENVLGNEYPVTLIHGLPGSGKTILLGETALKIRDTFPYIFLFKFSGVSAKEHAYFIDQLNNFLTKLNAGIDPGLLTNQDWRRSLEALSKGLIRTERLILLLDSVDQAPYELIDSLLDLLPQTKMVMTARSRIISESKALFLSIPPLQKREIAEFLILFGISPDDEDDSMDWLERIPNKIKENPQRLKLLITNLRDIPLELLLVDGMDELSQHPSKLIHTIVQELDDNTLHVFSLIILLEGLELFASLKALKIAFPKGLRKALTELIGKSLIYRQGDAYLVPSLVHESAIEKIAKTISDETVQQIEGAIRKVSNALQDYYGQFNELFPIIANFFVHLEELEYHEQIINLATEDLIETMNLQGFWKEYRLILRITYEAAKLQNNLSALANIGFRIVRKSFQIRDMQSSRQTLSELENILETDPHSRLSAELLSHQALFTELDGNSQAALEQLQQSFQIHKDLGNKESMSIIKNLMGNIYLRKKEITKARKNYETALHLLGDEKIPLKQALEVETNIAICDFLERKWDKAQTKFNDIVEKCKEIGFLAGLPRSYYFLAQVLDQKRQYAEALQFAKLAAELASHTEQYIIAGADVLSWKIKNQHLQELEE